MLFKHLMAVVSFKASLVRERCALNSNISTVNLLYNTLYTDVDYINFLIKSSNGGRKSQS